MNAPNWQFIEEDTFQESIDHLSGKHGSDFLIQVQKAIIWGLESNPDEFEEIPGHPDYRIIKIEGMTNLRVLFQVDDNNSNIVLIGINEIVDDVDE